MLAALTSLRVLCLLASWQPGADESRGMLLPTQIDRQARRIVGGSQLTRVGSAPMSPSHLPTQGRELLDFDLAEAPELPLSEVEEPLRLRPSSELEEPLYLGRTHARASINFGDCSWGCGCEKCVPPKRDR